MTSSSTSPARATWSRTAGRRSSSCSGTASRPRSPHHSQSRGHSARSGGVWGYAWPATGRTTNSHSRRGVVRTLWLGDVKNSPELVRHRCSCPPLPACLRTSPWRRWAGGPATCALISVRCRRRWREAAPADAAHPLHLPRAHTRRLSRAQDLDRLCFIPSIERGLSAKSRNNEDAQEILARSRTFSK